MGAQIRWDVIESFIGYGSRNAPVVFIGMEEGSGPDEDLTENLIERSRYDQIKPLMPRTTKLQSTWSHMCELMLRREGLNDITADRKRQYQTHRLGAGNGDTLLTELLPYPKRSRKDWPDIYRQRYESQAEYIREMVPRRQEMLANLFSRGERQLIIIYGKEHFERYHGLFGAKWENHFPFARTMAFGAPVIVTPHFTSAHFARHRKLFFELALRGS